jgi:hypothetical protein
MVRLEVTKKLTTQKLHVPDLYAWLFRYYCGWHCSTTMGIVAFAVLFYAPSRSQAVLFQNADQRVHSTTVSCQQQPSARWLWGSAICRRMKEPQRARSSSSRSGEAQYLVKHESARGRYGRETMKRLQSLSCRRQFSEISGMRC